MLVGNGKTTASNVKAGCFVDSSIHPRPVFSTDVISLLPLLLSEFQYLLEDFLSVTLTSVVLGNLLKFSW